MATIISRVRDISGTSTSETGNANVALFAQAGATYLVNVIPKDLLTFAGIDSSNVTTSSGFDLDYTSSGANAGDRIVMVRRNGVVCDELPKEHIYAHSGALSTTSLFVGSTVFPKYYIQNGSVFIKPDPTTAAVGVVTYIGAPAITSGTSQTALQPIENPMLLYAAALDCMAASSYWSAQALAKIFETNTGARDALDKAQYLIDSSTQLTQGEDAEYFLAQEDSEMIASNIQIAAQEVNRALAEVRSIEGAKQYTAEYLERSNLLFKQAQVEVDMYVNRNTKMMGLNAILATQQGSRE